MTCSMKSRHCIKREIGQIFKAALLITWNTMLQESRITEDSSQ